MFDIGFWELVLISIIALVVLGPERLPQAIRTVARYVRTAKRMANHVKDELSRELQVQELKDDLKNAKNAGRKMMNSDLSISLNSIVSPDGDKKNLNSADPTEASHTDSHENDHQSKKEGQ